MIKISSDRLEAALFEPGEGKNSKTRFDRAGFIFQVILDGKQHFCGVEPDNLAHPGTGGAGLCGEIRQAGEGAELENSACFPKFGVGLIHKKGNEPYRFFDRYECDFFDTTFEPSTSSVTFTVRPKPYEGYALKEKKVVALRDNTLSTEIYFENTGDKPLELREYNHNFVTLADHPADEHVRLLLPTLSSQEGKRAEQGGGTMRGGVSGFGFTGIGRSPSMIGVSADEIDKSKPFAWTLMSDDSDVSITEETSFIPSDIIIWSIGTIVSPEVFHTMTVMPGCGVSYSRVWTFRN
ncbi:MAG: hypothetical protein LBB94_05045 [Clostridiales bacterium]|jgi:hypothetical protein|nr:hypothetical protein [Clostridiales bacterium]